MSVSIKTNLLSFLYCSSSPCSCFTCSWNASNCLQCDWSRVLFKEALWSSPCWYGRAAHHSSYRTYAHHMYISRQCSEQQLCTQPPLSLHHPCTHADCMCLWTGTEGHTHLSVHTHSDIWYLCSQKLVSDTSWTDKYPFKLLSVWHRTSVIAATSCNSNIIKMTRAISAAVSWKYSNDCGGIMQERNVRTL